MTPEELTCLLESAKREFEEMTADLELGIRKAEERIKRNTAKLNVLREDYAKKVDVLARGFAGLPVSAPETSPPHRRQVEGASGIKRGALDQPMADLVKSLGSRDLTIPELTDEWNRRNPDQPPVQRSTVRGIAQRLVEKGILEEHIRGRRGGDGSNPTKYRLKEQPEVESTPTALFARSAPADLLSGATLYESEDMRGRS